MKMFLCMFDLYSFLNHSPDCGRTLINCIVHDLKMLQTQKKKIPVIAMHAGCR